MYIVWGVEAGAAEVAEDHRDVDSEADQDQQRHAHQAWPTQQGRGSVLTGALGQEAGEVHADNH